MQNLFIEYIFILNILQFLSDKIVNEFDYKIYVYYEFILKTSAECTISTVVTIIIWSISEYR